MNLNASACEKAKEICCNLDVWGILVTIILQDAPFFCFRLIIIIHYRLVNSMNLFCTAKNTLVITLQVCQSTFHSSVFNGLRLMHILSILTRSVCKEKDQSIFVCIHL